MHEKYQPPCPENNFHGHLSEGMLKMMDFEAAILDHRPPSDERDFDEERVILFGRKIEQHREVFDSLFTNRNFHPVASFPNLAPLVRVCLLTAPQIVMDDRQEHNRGTQYKNEFSLYNNAMRDAISANPYMSKVALKAILEASMFWARVPVAYHRQSRSMFDRIMSGASAEVIARTLFEEANIEFEDASIENDLDGFDFIVTSPGGRRLKIDIKSSSLQIEGPQPLNNGSPRYEIGEECKVKLYTGVGDVLRKGQLQLDQEYLGPKSIALAKTLQEIAQDIEELETREEKVITGLLAQLALKFNN